MAYKKRSYLLAFASSCAISFAALLHPVVADYFTERETIATVCGKELIVEKVLLVIYEVRTHNDRMSIIGFPRARNKELYGSLQKGSVYRFKHYGFTGRIKSIQTATPVTDQLVRPCPR
jgi:hypothetical protein